MKAVRSGFSLSRRECCAPGRCMWRRRVIAEPSLAGVDVDIARGRFLTMFAAAWMESFRACSLR